MAAERQWQHGRHPLGVVLQKVIEGYSRNFLTIDQGSARTMSYAGPSTRSNRSPRTDGSDEEEVRPRAAAALRAANWPSRAPNGQGRQATVFAAGLVVGLALGAGVALLFAPESGAHMRRALIRRGRRVTLRGRDAWDDLRDELRSAVRDRMRERRRRRAAREMAKAAEK